MKARSTLILIIASAALGAAVWATVIAPAQPRIFTTMEGHRG